MLKMMCPHCHELIISSLLAEIDEVFCHHCNEGVAVQNILISARGMTISRDDLLKRFFRYKKLLTEVLAERALMDKDTETLEISKKSSDQFIETLEEFMAGARGNYRLHFSISVPVRLSFDGKIQAGWLLNLSMAGVCIEIENYYLTPEIGSLVALEFSLPGQSTRFSLVGTVSWIRKGQNDNGPVHDLGIRFADPDEASRDNLWQLISASVRGAMTTETIN